MNRESSLQRLSSEEFDVLVIGGGATGAGAALDAASRGLKTALVERDDFAAETSSKSTKLLHGGVRYLEKAVLQFDRGQFKLVREALHERSTLLALAPHLARVLPILTPLYRRREVPYVTTGLKLYDWLAGKAQPKSSRYVPASEAIQLCPTLRPEGLRGAVLYYDGQFDDARMCVAIAITAYEEGAAVVNHAEVKSFLKTNGKITGALVRDCLSDETVTVRARTVINATGPFADELRKLDDPTADKLLTASSGSHIVLHKRFSPPEVGMLIPKTEDGRVLFVLPWLGHTLVGTTDNPAEVSRQPKATDDDVAYILRQIKKYLALDIGPGDALARWSGLRPLVANPGAGSTENMSRDHLIVTSGAGLVTITGGKWTTYRRMAEDVVDEAVKTGALVPKTESRTESIKLAGGENYRADGLAAFAGRFGLDPDVAKYLHHAYGSRAERVAEIAAKGFGDRLAPHHPCLAAEIVYAARAEGARTTADAMARRLRLAFLDREAARNAVPRVQEILAKELGWEAARLERDRREITAYLG